jgi:hypothetical protein
MPKSGQADEVSGPSAGRPPRNLDAAVAPFDLPAESAALARAIARRTGLRRREQARAARKLAVEIRHHLDSGAQGVDVPRLLGDLDQLAARLRQEGLAQRGIASRILGGWKLWALLIVAAPVILYIVLFIRFQIGEPVLRRNFAAEFNAAVLGLAPEQRAEPVYVEACRLLQLPEQSQRKQIEQWLELHPAQSAWAEPAGYLELARPALDLTRRAAAMPHMGRIISDSLASDPWNLQGQQDDAPSENPRMVHILLPHLPYMRALGHLLALEALHAAAHDDAARSVESLVAMLGLVRHLREHPLLIADLVSVHLLKLAGQRAGLLVSEYPGLFSDEQLAELSAAFAAMTDTSLLLRLDGERAFFQDMLQRIYTDDGRGDGRMTRRGLLELRTVMHFQTEPELSLGDHLSGPLILLGAPSRRELETTWERMAWRVRTDAAVYPYQRRSYDGEVEMLEMRRRARPGYELITSLMPAFAHAFARIDEARQARDAALIALALERSRLRLGQYPADLVALTPELLERIPIDIYAFDNGTLRYMLRGGRPLVYSVGRNGEDDGADFTIPEDDPEYIPWRNQPRDILLWPPPPPRGVNQ